LKLWGLYSRVKYDIEFPPIEELLMDGIGQEEGAPVTSNAVHPGAVTTKLGRNFFNHAITGFCY
jgi:NAD(P)-dependent dehydrogenase (short-subunit alcohol dehydrogenase family)